ncbi:MlaD family protein [Nocardia asteroides]|uniref:MlaD family protein n=1 Tax=Nocardia asteroides TaxID=1824 RepID=UPI001E47C087|nr:MlaD family protein [Nocardia asteroides]UGT55127.1 MlaD family protein [Nocardia asteroides]
MIARPAGLVVALAAASVLVTSACTVDPNRVPVPGTSIGSGYGLTFEFTSAMNLPDRANVMMNGLRVGQVQTMEIRGSAVSVTARILDGTRVPVDVTPAIRQDTLLGDTYIALEQAPDSETRSYLNAGAVVPLNRTIAPPQLEDVMAVLANFINGGSVQRLQDTIVQINGVMPPAPEVGHLAATVSTDLQDLAARNVEIDRVLIALNDTAISVDQSGPQLSEMFADSSRHYWFRLNDAVTQYVGTLLPSIGSIFEGGLWLIPMLESLANGATVIRSTSEDVPRDVTAMTDFLNNTLLPFLRSPSINVQSVTTGDGADLTPDMANILRMLGAIR